MKTKANPINIQCVADGKTSVCTTVARHWGDNLWPCVRRGHGATIQEAIQDLQANLGLNYQVIFRADVKKS
jgi:hypothetical protein